MAHDGATAKACFPESGSEGFYFSGLGGLGGGTERTEPKRNRNGTETEPERNRNGTGMERSGT